MASKVNVKFVAILSVSLVAFAVIVGVAGYVLVIKSGAEHARIGDRYAEAGDWDQAMRSYSKAVNKELSDPEYLVKWSDAIKMVNPATETEYTDLLFNDLFTSYRELSRIQTSDVAAQTQLLEFMYSQFELSTPTPAKATSLVNQATTSVERFEASPPADDSWKTLYRYRGIPLASALNGGETVDEPQLTQIRTDLEQALVGDPSDAVAAVSLSQWYVAEATAKQGQGRTEEHIALLSQAVDRLNEFLIDQPNSSRAMLEWVIRSNQLAAAQATQGMRTDDALATQFEMRSDMGLHLTKIVDLVMAADPETIDPNVLLVFSRVEAVADPDSGLALSRQIAGMLAEARPEDIRILVVAAEIDERRADSDGALARYNQIAEMENLPVSMEGFVRINIRRDAKYNRARIKIDQLLQDMQSENFEAGLAEAVLDRDDFAQQVSAEDPKLFMLDGMIAQANGDLTVAREYYRQYNEQTLASDTSGLWRQVQVAIDLNFVSEAESLIHRMLELQPGNRTATLALAEVKFRMNQRLEALMLFETVAEFDSTNTVVQNRISVLRAQLQLDAEGVDPELAIRIQAQSLRTGTAAEPGDLEAAAEYLASEIEGIEYAEPVALDLIQLYLDLSRLEDARSVADTAVEANPESEVLNRFKTALQSDSVSDTLIALIEQSDRTEVDKAMTKYRVLRTLKLEDQALVELEKAMAINPDHPELIETRFDQAINDKDLALATELATIAAELNLDRADGALYRARVLSTEGKHSEAVAVLEQAIDQGKTFPMAFRLLAREYSLDSRFELAISTLERALALNQEEPSTKLQYIQVLAASGRTAEALAVARQAQSSGIAPSYITNAWLELEALTGGEEGRAAAILRRESIRNVNPENEVNTASLAELYILNRQFELARPLIIELRAARDSVPLVMLDMRWHTDQGRLLLDGEVVEGLVAAQTLFQEYLLDQSESDLTAETYLSYARFMVAKKQVDLALPAIKMARELQSPETMDADRLLGDLYYSRGQFSDALTVFEKIVSAGADLDDQSYRKRLVECQIRLDRFDEASSTLEGVQEIDLTSTLQRAEIMFGQDRTSEGRSILDQAVQQYPDNPMVFVHRAEANLGSEELAGDVQADLETALRLDPKNWRALRLRGVLSWNQGRRDQAIRDIRNAVAANPRLEQLLYGLMNELIAIGLEGQAADIADETIRARSTDAQLMLNCARVFANHQIWDRAAEYTGKAWVQSKDPTVGVLLIDSLVRMEPPRAAEAENIYNALFKLIPDAQNNMMMLAVEATVRHSLGRENSAIRSLTAALLLAKENPGAVLNWADHVSRVYRKDSAETAAAMKLIGSDPELEISDMIRGWLEYTTAQQLVAEPEGQAEGIEMLRSLRDRDDADPLSQLAYRNEGTLHYSNEDYEQARTVWSDGIERFTEDWEMLNNLAYLYASQLGQADQGLPLAERALQLAPSQISSHDTLAMVYIELERYEEAQTTLNQAASLATSTAQQISLSIAKIRLYLAMGEIEQARKLSTDTRSIVFGSIELAEMGKALDELDLQIDSASP